jgi:hypothetical protein
MAESPTLSTAPLEHPALDYAFLREQGIRYLERIAGQVWTDFNAHDPGITILEQLCYALTELAYRAAYEVPELLASGGGDPYQSLYSPATILTSHPVTLLDLRKVMLDVEGVKNAWIEAVEEPAVALYQQEREIEGHEGRSELGFQAEPPYTTKLLLRGLHRVVIEKSDLLDLSEEKVQREVTARLHACRPLCTDFEMISVLASQAIQVQAEVEIGPVDDAERVLLDVYQILTEYVAPSIPFATLGQMQAAGKRSDEIFDGPALEHGFIDSALLDRLARKDAIYTSDLIREIMAVPGVRTVRNITLTSDGAPEAWRLPLDAAKTPRLDLRGSTIVLTKGYLTARLDSPKLIDLFIERRKQTTTARRLAASDRDFIPPAARDRGVGRYRSIQHEFPAIYGIGAASLPDSAPARRKAQAKQLRAYLLFFDQLLANQFAQLAHAGSLFSFHQPDPRTYFAQLIDDPDLELNELRVRGLRAHRDRLDQLVHEPAQDAQPAGPLSSRRTRFLNHLMARFAEQFGDYSLVLLDIESGAQRAADDMLAFLQRYPRISSARGTGLDLLTPPGPDTETESGLAERIARKLGLAASDGERFLLIEHLLLRPIQEDDLAPVEREYLPIPLLSGAHSGDPYSLQLSFVFPNWAGRLKSGEGASHEFGRLVEQTIRDQTPAHLVPYIHWLTEAEWKMFERAYHAFWVAQRAYRLAKLGSASTADTEHFAVRDARDRLIDLLGLGETYPLRDVPVRDERLTVAFNQPAQIPIEHSQRGVLYQLRSDRDDAVITRPEGAKSVTVEAEGNDETLYLLTPPIQEDITFNILARKLATGREAYLQQQATVKVGLDIRLPARILDAALLDPNLQTRPDDAARIVAHGARVKVQIDLSQEGVDYHLLSTVNGNETKLSPMVRGRQADAIVLETEAVAEDVDLRIRATKVFDPSENRPTQTDLLEVVLPLKVRANLAPPVSVKSTPIVGYGKGAVIQIQGTQPSASYHLYLRAALDSDFVFEASAEEQLGVDVENEARVLVRRPPKHPIWHDIEGFRPIGTAAQGDGATLSLPLDALTRDSVILVQAQKQHRAAGALSIPSSVQLAEGALILVQPDPKPPLELKVVMDGEHTTGTLDMIGGQPGVFYYVRTKPDGDDLGPPAYFHKTDERNPAENKGIGQLRVEGDFAITRGTLRPATTSAELAATPPLPPQLETGPLDAGTTLHLRAVKAQTRVAVKVTKTALIAKLPEIAAVPASVPKGTAATIVVRTSVAGERYELLLDGQVIGQPLDGNGADLTLTSGALQAATRFAVRVTRPNDSGVQVTQHVNVNVSIDPPP